MIRRLLVAAVVGLVPIVGALPAAHADAFFQAETNAAAVHLTITQEPADSIITASLIDDAVSYVSSGFDSGGSSEALAASAFPGRLVVQGPQLLCSQLFPCPAQPPDYPFLADASYPRRSHDTAAASGTAMGSGPFIVTPLQATAAADANGNSSQTEAGAMNVLGGTPGAVDVGASSASTAVHSTNGRLEVTVSTFVHDVTIAGLVHIDSVHATDVVTVEAGKRPAAEPHITIGGVTVAGHTASIDDAGLHVDGTDGPSLAAKVAKQGVTVHTVGAQRHNTSNGTRSDATALAVDVALPVHGVPYIPNPLPPLPPPFDQIPALPGINANGVYVGHITLGAVGVAAGVGTEPTFDLGSTPASPVSTTPGSRGSRAATGTSAPLGGNDLVTNLATPPAQRAPAVAAGSPGPLRSFVDLLSKTDVETLYLVLALGTLGLFIGWRAIVAIRTRRTG